MRIAINQRRTLPILRALSTSHAPRESADSNADKERDVPSSQDEPKEESAMARRLSEMTEDALVEGGRSAQKNIQEAGFSEELKAKLSERVAASTFKSDYAAAHSIVNMPVCPGIHKNMLLVRLFTVVTGKRRTRNSRHRGICTLDGDRRGLRYYPPNAG